ncbi:hypothetical protein N657DRAFT_633497 [Parathielavia appendiculata]|uniref:Uncharacterized protein n=1 Tax=Parathielavia appendiculata TaxID=2587402 RepID=A0AAN6Z4D0_9PEZI|nr:hypothetical protein N657DRAFT_633497 [Parathielavia appendiculata]
MGFESGENWGQSITTMCATSLGGARHTRNWTLSTVTGAAVIGSSVPELAGPAARGVVGGPSAGLDNVDAEVLSRKDHQDPDGRVNQLRAFDQVAVQDPQEATTAYYPRFLRKGVRRSPHPPGQKLPRLAVDREEDENVAYVYAFAKRAVVPRLQIRSKLDEHRSLLSEALARHPPRGGRCPDRQDRQRTHSLKRSAKEHSRRYH